MVSTLKTSPLMESNHKTDFSNEFDLKDGSRICVIGGGPAGSMFSYFSLDMAERVGLELQVDIYEPRDFFRPSPAGCNMCGGIISETLVQMLAAEGIKLPPQIIQRGIDSYTLHTDTGTAKIETPLHEKRIGAVHRGCGPRDIQDVKWGSFDGYLQILAMEKGASVYQTKVTDVEWQSNYPIINSMDYDQVKYDLVVVAVGINSNSLKMFPPDLFGYKPPGTTNTMIREYFLGQDLITEKLGNSMHIFLLDMPGLEFAAFIPKGDYVTFCMLGKGINDDLLNSFMNSSEVRGKLPEELFEKLKSCHCNPRINIVPAIKLFSDRIVFIGDSGVSRLYKDGIGAAYKTAKAAAMTAVFEGVSKNSFKKFYAPVCKSISRDNLIGKLVFKISSINQKMRIARNTILYMVQQEQKNDSKNKHMSRVMWNMFTGSASYREIFVLTLHPLFILRYIAGLLVSIFSVNSNAYTEE